MILEPARPAHAWLLRTHSVTRTAVSSRILTHSLHALSRAISLSLSLSLHCRLLKQILALFEPLIEAAIEAAEMLANGLENAVGGIIDKVPGLKSLGSMFGM